MAQSKAERQVLMMATKSANVTACVQPEIKKQAETVLDRIGLPVSVLIDILYRQIIMTGGVPFPLAVPKLPTRDSLTDGQFNAMMETGYHQAKSGEGLPIDEAFAKILLTPETARRWADTLQCEIGKMDSMPSRYPLTEEEPWHTKGIRKMPVKNFLVYYWLTRKIELCGSRQSFMDGGIRLRHCLICH